MISLRKVAARTSAITLLFLFSCLSVFSQNTVSGILQDANSGNPVQYANVSLLRQSDSVLVSHTYANDKGICVSGTCATYLILIYFPFTEGGG